MTTIRLFVNITTEDGELLDRVEVEFATEPDGYAQWAYHSAVAVLGMEVRSAAQIVARRLAAKAAAS